MAFLVDKYTFIFHDLADKRVESWPLMGNPWMVLGVIGLYLWIVLRVGPWFMRERPAYDLRRVLQLYNIGQVLSCSALIYGLMTNGWTAKYSVFECHPVDYSMDEQAVRLANWFWWTMVVKLAELLETVFFVLRKKQNQVSGLHLYHHATSLLFIWLGVKYVAGGMASFAIILNSFVHVLMYTYYFLATLGPEWQRLLAPLKPKLTVLQMVQFCIIICHTSIALREECKVPHIIPYMFIPNVVIIFYMFYDFFKKSYLKKVKSKL